MASRRCLVTGGCGFIGSHLVAALLERGDTVRVFDNFSTGRPDNLGALADDVELLEGDLRDLDAVRRAVEGVEYVLHQAALASVPRSVATPIATHEADATGTLHVLVASRDAGVRRVLYAGSSSAYGDAPTLPKEEEMRARPLSPYAVAKLTGEHYCAAFTRSYGLETVTLRYFNIFGPRQDPASQYAAVIPRFITAMMASQPPTIYGDGTQSRDFTYVDNAVQANLLALDASDASGETINVACGQRYSLLDLVASLNEILGTAIAPRHDPRRPGDVLHSLASIEKAERLLGYRPVVEFREGLRRTAAWYQTLAARGA